LRPPRLKLIYVKNKSDWERQTVVLRGCGRDSDQFAMSCPIEDEITSAYPGCLDLQNEWIIFVEKGLICANIADSEVSQDVGLDLQPGTG
jgi:hypothetical protein